MSNYKKVLAAIDLTQECNQVLEKAVAMAGAAGIHVIHVSQPLAQMYGGEIGINLASIEVDLHKQAEKLLTERLASFNVPADKQHIGVGKPAAEIRRYAEEIGADLVVIGTHSRHGLGILLGSTANGVLHGIGCDVLAVRINAGG